MEIDQQIPRAVGALYGDVGRGPQALGTCFLMSVPDTSSKVGTRLELVTAAHVVPIGIVTRVRLAGEPVPFEALRWRRHLTEDVAVASVAFEPLAAIRAYDISSLLAADVPGARATCLGDDVAFFGLLPNLEQSGLTGLPVLRAGNVARLDQPGIRYRAPGDMLQTGTAHLIDCRATRGMSGGPCFVAYFDKWLATEGVTLGTSIRLLGLVSGHFDDPVSGVEGANNPRTVAQHTGIGLVTPVRFILQALMDEEATYEA